MPQFGSPPLLPEAKSIETAWKELLTGPATDNDDIKQICEKYMVPHVIYYLHSNQSHNLAQLVDQISDIRAKFTLMHLHVRDYVAMDSAGPGWKKVAVRYESVSRVVVEGKEEEDGRMVRQECMQFLVVNPEGKIVRGTEMSRDVDEGAVGTI